MAGVDFFLGNFGFGPVEAAGVVGAGGLAVAAPDAPVVVDDDDAVFLFPGGFDRTDVDAGWIFALLALDGHVEFVGLGNGVVVVGITVFHVH